jgi:hypothetical protein
LSSSDTIIPRIASQSDLTIPQSIICSQATVRAYYSSTSTSMDSDRSWCLLKQRAYRVQIGISWGGLSKPDILR